MKTDNGGNNPNKPIFGVQIDQDDASRLIGGIVEKGFSEQAQSRPLVPPAGPRPSVIPFPVARHRSHGPHWTAIRGGIDGNGEAGNDEDDDKEGEVEEDFSEFERVKHFAQPLQKKEKKGLDFTRWREILAADDDSAPNKQVKRKHSTKSVQNKGCKLTEVSEKLNNCAVAVEGDLPLSKSACGDDSRLPAVIQVSKERERRLSDMEIDTEQQSFKHDLAAETFVSPQEMSTEYLNTMEEMLFEKHQGPVKPDNSMQVDTHKQYMATNNVTSGLGSYKVADQHGSISLESEIDAENCSQLEKMSVDEIAEAQAEIMAKMGPALVDALKKRGLEKLKRKKRLGVDTVADGEVRNLQAESNCIGASALPDHGSFHKVTEKDAEDVKGDGHNCDGPNFYPKNSSLWDSWSKRVEDVRNLRFSLEGDMIKSDLPQVCGTDNVCERDFLRTEGNPAAAGYTIKEAVALTRSVVPGQRALALHVLMTVLDKALHNILQNKAECTLSFSEPCRVMDSEAIWAFAIGPEPELALSLRICLDDNNNSVILACTKVIQAVLSCDVNESFFNTSEKLPSIRDDISTAAVFRTKPDFDVGFLRGGFWKYNAKPANILPSADDMDDKREGEHTIQDDVVVAGQDVAAGFVRMGILARIRYLLEAEPSASLGESLLSILIAIARHSPTCAAAIMTCERLVKAVVERFSVREPMGINSSKINSVTLLKVLARANEKNCVEFIKNGIFQKMTWHLFRYCSLDQWIKSGRDSCKLSSALLIEQLRLWRVCLEYGYCVSYFADLFPCLSIWLTVPTFEILLEKDILCEFTAISMEAYLVIQALTKRLPNFYSPMHPKTDARAEEGIEKWSWSHVVPLIDLALEWVMVKKIPLLSRLFDLQEGDKGQNMLSDSTVNPLLWVVSSVMHMLSGVLEVMIPKDPMDINSGRVPWLPEFVPRIGLALIKNGYFHVSGADVSKFGDYLPRCDSFLECLCNLRHKYGEETSIVSASCLQGLLQVVLFVDKMIRLVKPEMNNRSLQDQSFSRDDKVLADGIVQSSRAELENLLRICMKFASDCHCLQSIEIFGRGGPAPGIGVGWGASGGGFWSTSVLLAQVDARLITSLLEIFQCFFVENPFTVEYLHSSLLRINFALEVCSTAGPRERSVVDKLFDVLFQVPVLKWLDFGINKFLQLKDGVKTFEWKYEEGEFVHLCALLASHFKSRWLSTKKKYVESDESQSASKKGSHLSTIYEDIGDSNIKDKGVTSLVQEWARQRLPLPNHWFLSPISATHYSKKSNRPGIAVKANCDQEQADFTEVAQAGLFFVLGLESMSDLLTAESQSSIQNVPIVWKVHALSVMLVDGVRVLENKKSRDVYETLQNVYGQLIDKLKLSDVVERASSKLLNFQSEIHESYSTFLEMLIDQFAAVSYGDLVFGRQISIYLHQCVEASVRLLAWNALSNAHALELLPPLEMCFSNAVGYLDPIEENEMILEAYIKSWVSGALDKAVVRRSASFTLALHHLASFFFSDCIGEKLSLRNKLVKSLLRDYSRKRQHEGMMMNLVEYKSAATRLSHGIEDPALLQICEVEKRRIVLLREACEGNSSLMNEVVKLEDCMSKRSKKRS